MDFLMRVVDVFLHLDKHLADVIRQYGVLTHLLLFAIIFVETGLVIMPFLPGDSLLFAAGTFAALGSLDLWLLLILLTIAAIAGDTVNYWIGSRLGDRALSGEFRWIKKAHIERTHAFFEKHGGKTIFLARFVPIVRTFAPFVAGAGRMSYRYFISYNVMGGIVWVGSCTLAGYYFGNIPFVREHFELVIMAIILVSAVPVGYEWLKARAERRTAAPGD